MFVVVVLHGVVRAHTRFPFPFPFPGLCFAALAWFASSSNNQGRACGSLAREKNRNGVSSS